LSIGGASGFAGNSVSDPNGSDEEPEEPLGNPAVKEATPPPTADDPEKVPDGGPEGTPNTSSGDNDVDDDDCAWEALIENSEKLVAKVESTAGL